MWLMIENSRVFFEKYYGTLTVIQREGIEYGVIDMWEAYISDDQKLFREGRIYYRYHIMSRMSNAVDLVHKNVVAEGLSSKVKAQTIKQTACGFCNSDNFKTVIYFHCRGLDFYPL